MLSGARLWLLPCALVVGCVGEIGDSATAAGVGGNGGAGGTGGETAGNGGTPAGGGGTGALAGSGGGDGGSVIPPTPCDVSGTPGECIELSQCTDGGVAVPGYCDGPFEVKCCVHDELVCDPESQVLPNNGFTEEPGFDGCPNGMIRIDAFCIDQYEASLETMDGWPWSPYFNPGDTPVKARSVKGAVPQGYINGVQSAAACENAGKRLCTDNEWLRACQGPDTTIYPYGDTLDPGVCNDARAQHPVVEYFGTADDWIWSELGNACISQLPDSLDRAGQNPGCVTTEGAFDMMGNLHEWTADPNGTFRGGFYVDTVKNGPGCLYKTGAHDVWHWDYSTGFRCCADAPM
ncbi:MAG: SUMF1/EgtB/PvdO family nonheme iron enzyme [Polyangiaceae bacterium]|nr:SUMF1/EgtB/PvdO family nonheme iron enzyme [Polyangiaceae bacterium]